ncbi:MAG: LysR family transcriptional regulator substrate-binding protein [Thomasclavelia spiroformis]
MHSIAEIFKRIHNQYPNIKYHIFSGSTLEVSEQLNKGLLDFAILIEPIDLEKYNYLKLPYTDTWVY